MSESQKFVESFIAELTSAKIFKERVKDKVLLFDNKNVLTDKQEMKELKRKRKKLNKFNSKEKKKLKLYHFEKDTLRYETFLDLHSLWSQYMAELLGDNLQKNAVLNKMIKADFHGCYMKVFQSKCPSLIGVEGIMIQETENTFKIITKKNFVKVVPKFNTNFTFNIKDLTLTIFGSQFKSKSGERITRKFKGTVNIDL